MLGVQKQRNIVCTTELKISFTLLLHLLFDRTSLSSFHARYKELFYNIDAGDKYNYRFDPIVSYIFLTLTLDPDTIDL